MNTNANTIKLHRRVFFGLDTLSESEKEAVMQAIHSLESFSLDKPLTEGMKRLETEQQLYRLYATSTFGLIFGVEAGNEIEILDIFNREMVDYYFGKEQKLQQQAVR
ncbi:MAG: hypothetical protein F6K41_25575 [Symploca sp. SIO3E6]|nr:hypothetical protein [Caldora sp. SIO3E6]